jgi:hypothetical protein
MPSRPGWLEWQACAKRLAHAYRNNSTKENTRAFVEYARLAAHERAAMSDTPKQIRQRSPPDFCRAGKLRLARQLERENAPRCGRK